MQRNNKNVKELYFLIVKSSYWCVMPGIALVRVVRQCSNSLLLQSYICSLHLSVEYTPQLYFRRRVTSKLASGVIWGKMVPKMELRNVSSIQYVSLHNILTKMTIWHRKDVFAEGEQNLRNGAFTNIFSLEWLLNLTCNLEVTC